jgi:hypothetical protein
MNCQAMKPKAMKGKEAFHVAADERRVDEAQAENEGSEADGDPERPKQRAAIALPDVVDTDGDPQPRQRSRKPLTPGNAGSIF